MSKHYERSPQVGGAVVFWRLASESSQPKLFDLMADIGHEALAPKKRQLRACLRDAMEDYFPSKSILIRPLSKLNGFVAVLEKRGEKTNDYNQLLAAWLEGEDSPQLRIRPSYTDAAEKIEAAFHDQRDVLRPAQLGSMLTHAISFLGGTTLRETGGIYWLAQEQLREWEKIADCARCSSTAGETTCYMLRNVMDEESVRAVRDAICHEVKSSSERLHAEIMSGHLKKRALEARRSEADNLRGKIAKYELLLDSWLGHLREDLEMVEEAAAAAIILQAGGVTEE